VARPTLRQPSARPYSISDAARQQLDGLVDRIQARPGDLIDVREFVERQQTLDVKQVVRTLPEGLSEDDLAGISALVRGNPANGSAVTPVNPECWSREQI
jgi:hypothetical protein